MPELSCQVAQRTRRFGHLRDSLNKSIALTDVNLSNGSEPPLNISPSDPLEQERLLAVNAKLAERHAQMNVKKQ